jgi:hypothetical protein
VGKAAPESHPARAASGTRPDPHRPGRCKLRSRRSDPGSSSRPGRLLVDSAAPGLGEPPNRPAWHWASRAAE